MHHVMSQRPYQHVWHPLAATLLWRSDLICDIEASAPSSPTKLLQSEVEVNSKQKPQAPTPMTDSVDKSSEWFIGGESPPHPCGQNGGHQEKGCCCLLRLFQLAWPFAGESCNDNCLPACLASQVCCCSCADGKKRGAQMKISLCPSLLTFPVACPLGWSPVT